MVDSIWTSWTKYPQKQNFTHRHLPCHIVISSKKSIRGVVMAIIEARLLMGSLNQKIHSRAECVCVCGNNGISAGPVSYVHRLPSPGTLWDAASPPPPHTHTRQTLSEGELASEGGRRVGPSLVYSLRFPSSEESMVGVEGGVEGVDTPARRSSVTVSPHGPPLSLVSGPPVCHTAHSTGGYWMLRALILQWLWRCSMSTQCFLSS